MPTFAVLTREAEGVNRLAQLAHTDVCCLLYRLLPLRCSVTRAGIVALTHVVVHIG